MPPAGDPRLRGTSLCQDARPQRAHATCPEVTNPNACATGRTLSVRTVAAPCPDARWRPRIPAGIFMHPRSRPDPRHERPAWPSTCCAVSPGHGALARPVVADTRGARQPARDASLHSVDVVAQMAPKPSRAGARAPTAFSGLGPGACQAQSADARTVVRYRWAWPEGGDAAATASHCRSRSTASHRPNRPR